ncbi:FAD-dependent monooxygenase [Methanobrevibacter sp. TMH8]|uniref:FAD-dependent monooxygenase n=1 Tax=Methanobrevibacter sp. TMH8 TaxID=2848611 RepID=UPI001CCF09A1|nr:FAD-dependent monooxygenase [Methanobrevibacter sp. TMH8]MBZ9571294.1 FAD-dependent monooxygenase [Methanobrevibacter sp. TMH8]
MTFDYDVAIVGAGPIGSTLAYKIANCGYSVVMLEKKKKVGVPLQCAGIVSKKLRDFNEIPDELILNEAKGAYLYSVNHSLKVEKDETEALIIDRVAYDQFLVKKAIDAGAKLFNKYKVIEVNSKTGLVKCQNNEEIHAKVIVGADGSKSFISGLFNKEFKYFNASQYLIKTDTSFDFNNNDIRRGNSTNNTNNKNNCSNSDNNYNNNPRIDFVDIFAISKILPGFLWCIPTSKNRYRIGLFSNNNYKDQKKVLNEFLDNDNRFNNCTVLERYHGKIPIFEKNKKLVNERIILIGDAASQLKPTTGGGLIIGFDTCNIAKDAIIKFLDKTNEDNNKNENNNLDLLKDYEKNFKKKYSKELSYQLKVQKTIEILSDEDLDYMFTKLKDKNAEEIISKYGDMDKQSVLVKEFIKRGLIFSIIPKVFFRKLINIWSI